MLIFSVLYNTPRFFETRVQSMNVTTGLKCDKSLFEINGPNVSDDSQAPLLSSCRLIMVRTSYLKWHLSLSIWVVDCVKWCLFRIIFVDAINGTPSSVFFSIFFHTQDFEKFLQCGQKRWLRAILFLLKINFQIKLHFWSFWSKKIFGLNRARTIAKKRETS